MRDRGWSSPITGGTASVMIRGLSTERLSPAGKRPLHEDLTRPSCISRGFLLDRSESMDCEGALNRIPCTRSVWAATFAYLHFCTWIRYTVVPFAERPQQARCRLTRA